MFKNVFEGDGSWHDFHSYVDMDPQLKTHLIFNITKLPKVTQRCNTWRCSGVRNATIVAPTLTRHTFIAQSQIKDDNSRSEVISILEIFFSMLR